MIKRIRDFIYDINDIFVALLIVLIAAGIIIWRSSSIMKYPEYMAERQASANTANEIVIPEDIRPANNTVPANNAETNTVTPPENTVDPNQNAVVPPANTVDPGANTVDPNANTVPGGNTVTPPADVVKASITIEKGFKGGWNTVAERLIAAKLIKAGDKVAFVDKVNKLNLSTRLQIGTFELSSDMTFEQMIKKLCRVKD